MSGPTTSRPAGDPPLAERRPWRTWYVVPLVLVALVIVPLSEVLEPPAIVQRLRVENSTGYDVTLQVSDGLGRSWTTVGTARRRTTADFERVIDQGEHWTLRFRAQGQNGGELRIARQDLLRSGWKIRVPDSVAEQLQARGAPFPP